MKMLNVQFVLNSLSDSPTFKTHDTIDGEIIYTPHQETPVEDISIAFQGTTRIEVENLNTHIPLPVSQLQKTFLHMELPIYDYFGNTTTLKPGKNYRIPFKFIVPEELPIHACHHRCENDQVQQEHLRLPASLSYRAQKSHGTHDMSPEMAKVIYSINFAVWRQVDKAGKPKKIQESTHPVQILPTREEHAPILVPCKNKYYQLRAEKTLSKGVLRHAVGKLTAWSAQPPAMHLNALQPKHMDAYTIVGIDLRFEPAHPGELPPTLLMPEFQLRAMTFFGLNPWHNSPDLTDISTWGSRQGLWSEYVSLTSDIEARVDWKRTQEGNHTVFTASLVASVSLPTHRLYPPTGHSCLVSRTYALKTKLFYQAHGKTRGTSSMSLSVPLEICAT
ncbi:hypothetical protein N7457_003838 [Penicillium paradoxum]|uniref:uncharacterized protein n=1 Tax=Penicillium paradoxum TaxID=176176 RepID=UPI002546ABEA|nr:uncharacterized protein N7457_003838 [Penicillium paradoxum]KAJ5782064.1 hypothetical protein N7457_003838 [Penicillium paradoxum]